MVRTWQSRLDTWKVYGDRTLEERIVTCMTMEIAELREELVQAQAALKETFKSGELNDRNI